MRLVNTLLVATALGGCPLQSAGAQTPPEPGITAGIRVMDISRNTPRFGSVFPQVAVDPADGRMVALAWRRYGLPVDTNAPAPQRVAECHLALSRDGGRHFVDRDMMDVLRTRGTPRLWGCNAPWVAFGPHGVLYFGGSLFTAGGVLQKTSKQGRAGVTVSRDGGITWSKMVPGIVLDRLAPGMTGLAGGRSAQDTPWDGSDGVVDPITGTFYSSSGLYLAASADQGRTFGTVYPGMGTPSAAFGAVVAAGIVYPPGIHAPSGVFGTVLPARSVKLPANAHCPCLVVSTTRDRGAHWRHHLVAQTGDWNPVGTVRYPIAAASPIERGHYAVAVYTPDDRGIELFYTVDNGVHWQRVRPQPIRPHIPVESVNMVGTSDAPDGSTLVTWRGFRNPGAFNTFVAEFDGHAFGPTLKVSPTLSIYPPLTYAGNYGNGNGAGDFTTWVAANAQDAFVAFPCAPGGVIEDTCLARVPRRLLRGSAP
jgi:BNR/Asp-box repeat